MSPFSRILAAFRRPTRPRATEPKPAIGRQFSPLQIKSIESLANAGNLTLAADLCFAFMADGRVQSALAQRVGGLLSLPLDFDPGAKRSARALNAIQDDFFEALAESDLFQLYSWALLLGVGLGQITWQSGARGRLLPRLKVWNPRWLSFDFEENAWKLEVDGGEKIAIAPGDGQWVLYTPKSARAPWQHGLWRALNTPFFVKADGALDWARYNEVYGSPIRAFVGGQGISQRQLDAIADDLDTARGFTSVALPSGSEFHLVEATGSTWDTFREALAWASTEISVAILGQNLTTEVNGGSLAASRTHRDVESMLIAFDAQVESTWLHDQLLSCWAAYNFGDPALAPWPRRDTAEPEDLSEKASMLRSCGEAMAALRMAGLPLDLEALASTFGIPLVAGAEIGATPPAPDTPDTPDAPDAPDAPEDLSKTPKKAELRAEGAFRMAATSRERLPPGADLGFDHIDALNLQAEAAARPFIDAQEDLLFDAIEQASSPEDLAERLKAAFFEMESGELNALIERALILAELSGRLSAIEDL